MTFRNWLTVLVALIGITAVAVRRNNAGCYCDEQPDLSGRVFIVTGGHSGLGYETTNGLAKRGATIYVGCKDVEKGKTAVHNIQSEYKNAKIKVLKLDLNSFDSIREFAANFLAEKVPLHVLINNAGVWMGNNRTMTEDGYEITWKVNHLGHFLLTNLLLDKLKASVPSRVVTVSSQLYSQGIVDFDNLNLDKNYDPMVAYSNSKMMNVLFANELGRKLAGTGVVSSSLHPGVIATGLHRTLDIPGAYDLFRLIWGFLGKSPEYGAQTSLTAAISPRFAEKTSVYLAECEEKEVIPLAKDVEKAKKLWDLSEKLVGLNK